MTDEYKKYEKLFDSNFDEMSLTPEGLRYLKIRTLIDTETLKSSSILQEYFKIKKTQANGKKVNELRISSYDDTDLDDDKLNELLKRSYSEKFQEHLSLKELEEELKKVAAEGEEYWESWNGIYADDIRRHIQQRYVRNPRFVTLEALKSEIDNKLTKEAKGYTIISWYNQWSSHIIEKFIMTHPNVIPTLRRIDKVDFFLKDLPIDLKMTFIPKGYITSSIKCGVITTDLDIIRDIETNPIRLMKWLYENQGEQRFSANHRLFLISVNEDNISESWKLKSSFDKTRDILDEFLKSYRGREDTTQIVWNYKGSGPYTTYSKLIFIKDKI